MKTDTETAQHSDSTKKPYEAPKLVVMGDAAEMTQLGSGPALDTAAFSTPAGS